MDTKVAAANEPMTNAVNSSQIQQFNNELFFSS
jgi:hypothetical protein